jgi:hypothetical protein
VFVLFIRMSFCCQFFKSTFHCLFVNMVPRVYDVSESREFTGRVNCTLETSYILMLSAQIHTHRNSHASFDILSFSIRHTEFLVIASYQRPWTSMNSLTIPLLIALVNGVSQKLARR